MPELPEVEVTRRGIGLCRGPPRRACRRPYRDAALARAGARRAVARARGARRRASRQVPAVRGRRGLVHRPPRHDGHAARAARGRRAGRREARPHRLDLRRIRAAVPRSAPLRRGAGTRAKRATCSIRSSRASASNRSRRRSPARCCTRTRGRTVSVKQALLAGDMVVGVGNIYASESLFRAGIRPTTAAGRCRCALRAFGRRSARDACRRDRARRQHIARFRRQQRRKRLFPARLLSTTVRASHAAYATRRSARSCRASGRPISVRPASVETFFHN